jgi:hypothetical protein
LAVNDPKVVSPPLDPKGLDAAPPFPTDKDTVPPGVTGKLGTSTYPPAPPPPPPYAVGKLPPPPPPATASTQTELTPVGTLKVAGPVDVKYCTTSPVPCAEVPAAILT